MWWPAPCLPWPSTGQAEQAGIDTQWRLSPVMTSGLGWSHPGVRSVVMAGTSSICPGLVLNNLSSRHWHAVATHHGPLAWVALTCSGLEEMFIGWKCMYLNSFAINTNFIMFHLNSFCIRVFHFLGEKFFYVELVYDETRYYFLFFSFTINIKMVNDLQFGLFFDELCMGYRVLMIIYSLDTAFNSSYGCCHQLSLCKYVGKIPSSWQKILMYKYKMEV